MRSALVVCAAPKPDAGDFYGALITTHEGLLVAADGGADLCLENGRMPDLLVGDFDSIAPDVLERVMSTGARVSRAPADKDMSDLDLALRAAADLGVEGVLITAAWSGRLDHTLAAAGSVFAHKGSTIDLVDPGMRGCLLDARGRHSATLSGPGATFSLLTLDADTLVSCEGARYELLDAALSPLSTRGLSNVLLDKPARVRAVSGRLLVVTQAVGGIGPAAVSPDAP